MALVETAACALALAGKALARPEWLTTARKAADRALGEPYLPYGKCRSDRGGAGLVRPLSGTRRHRARRLRGRIRSQARTRRRHTGGHRY